MESRTCARRQSHNGRVRHEQNIFGGVAFKGMIRPRVGHFFVEIDTGECLENGRRYGGVNHERHLAEGRCVPMIDSGARLTVTGGVSAAGDCATQSLRPLSPGTDRGHNKQVILLVKSQCRPKASRREHPAKGCSRLTTLMNFRDELSRVGHSTLATMEI